MKYCIDAEADYYYIIWHYDNIYDVTGKKIKVHKRVYHYWKDGKFDITDYNNIRKIVRKPSPPKPKYKRLANYTEQDILQQVIDLMQGNNYIIESNIIIDDYSKALLRRTIQNQDLLSQFGLERIRLNKQTKLDIGVEVEGYPYVIKLIGGT